MISGYSLRKSRETSIHCSNHSADNARSAKLRPQTRGKLLNTEAPKFVKEMFAAVLKDAPQLNK